MRALALLCTLLLVGCGTTVPSAYVKPLGQNGARARYVVPQPVADLFDPRMWEVVYGIDCPTNDNGDMSSASTGPRLAITAERLLADWRTSRLFLRGSYEADDGGKLFVFQSTADRTQSGLWCPANRECYAIARSAIRLDRAGDQLKRAFALQIRSICGFSEAEVNAYFALRFSQGGLPKSAPSCF